MKVDRTKLTAEYENGVIKSMWISVEVALDSGMGESAMDALDLSKQISDDWYKKSNPLPYQNFHSQAPPTELPIINKAEERLGIEIENCQTREELMKYKDEIKTPYLSDIFARSILTLNK